jgi:hypothetical protein
MISTLALYQKSLFAWREWSAILGKEIKKAQARRSRFTTLFGMVFRFFLR